MFHFSGLYFYNKFNKNYTYYNFLKSFLNNSYKTNKATPFMKWLLFLIFTTVIS